MRPIHTLHDVTLFIEMGENVQKRTWTPTCWHNKWVREAT